jgi:hypothetical protein
LLLAHHKHWFDPLDPLREPFKNAGKFLGLPYVDVEGYVAVFTCDVACVLFEVTAFILIKYGITILGSQCILIAVLISSHMSWMEAMAFGIVIHWEDPKLIEEASASG